MLCYHRPRPSPSTERQRTVKIAVVGAGSIGTLFSSILYKSGQDVTLVEIRPEVVSSIQERGLSVTRGDETEVLDVPITSRIEDVPDPDLIMFTVKSYDNVTAARDCLKIIGDNTTVLTLQNGVGNYETISSVVGEERTCVGTTTFGATMYEPGKTRGTATGEISIGEYAGGITERINRLADLLRTGGFIVNCVEDVNSLVWTKLAVNVGINAIGALARLKNGETHSIEPAGEIQRLAVEEFSAVARAEGIDIDYDGIYRHVVDVTVSAAVTKCSMLQDIERRGRTEVKAINGAIVEGGKRHGIPTPVNLVLTRLVQAEQQSFGQ